MGEKCNENGGSIRLKWPAVTLIVYLVAQLTIFIWEWSDKNRRLIQLEEQVSKHVLIVGDARLVIIESEQRMIRSNIEKLQRTLENHDLHERDKKSAKPYRYE